MAIPAPQDDFEQQRQPYRALYQAVAKLGRPELDTFSFGMTGDLKAAIARARPSSESVPRYLANGIIPDNNGYGDHP